jgi:hypothetical protein
MLAGFLRRGGLPEESKATAAASSSNKHVIDDVKACLAFDKGENMEVDRCANGF